MILHLILFLAFFQVSAFELPPLDVTNALFELRNLEGFNRIKTLLPHKKARGQLPPYAKRTYLCPECCRIYTRVNNGDLIRCQHPTEEYYIIKFRSDSEIVTLPFQARNGILRKNPWLLVREIESGQITVHGTITRRQTTTTQAPVHTFA